MSSPLIPVILSGGNGTRLWPLSREEYPKQFLKLTDSISTVSYTHLDVYKRQEGSISKRKIIDSLYRNLLKGTPGITIFPGNINANSNYSYFPILIDDGFHMSRDQAYELLKKNNILSRKYFYPLISNMPMYRGLISASVDNLPIANSVADKVLCLPIYTDLNEEIVVKITKLLLGKM